MILIEFKINKEILISLVKNINNNTVSSSMLVKAIINLSMLMLIKHIISKM